MKRTDLLKRCQAIAREHGTTFDLSREGARHSQFTVRGQIIPVPRHREINERTASSIIRATETASRETQR